MEQAISSMNCCSLTLSAFSPLADWGAYEANVCRCRCRAVAASAAWVRARLQRCGRLPNLKSSCSVVNPTQDSFPEPKRFNPVTSQSESPRYAVILSIVSRWWGFKKPGISATTFSSVLTRPSSPRIIEGTNKTAFVVTWKWAVQASVLRNFSHLSISSSFSYLLRWRTERCLLLFSFLFRCVLD